MVRRSFYVVEATVDVVKSDVSVMVRVVVCVRVDELDTP
jgi:hypothetical protein